MDLREMPRFSLAAHDLCGREEQVTQQKVFTVHLAGAEPGKIGGGTGRGDTDLDLGNSPSSGGARYVLQMKT